MSFIPKTFQQNAVNNAVSALADCLKSIDLIRSGDSFAEERTKIISYKGTLLFEAPTGTGKTLMAASVAEKLSFQFPMVWFWFAPFNGLIDQAFNAIHSQFSGLRVKNLSKERNVKNIRSGDVFVTTWASVAVVNSMSRKIRQGSEHSLSVDELAGYLKACNYHIGVVIDEAHHSFLSQSQAFTFYREVLSPDVTIMVTATPKDADVESFRKRNELKHIHKISVSRAQGVDAGLLKDGVKVAVFKAKNDVETLIDFKKTALHSGVSAHREIKHHLSAIGMEMTPLLLVQADSTKKSIDSILKWLQELGFDDEQVRVHTAAEPDPHLLSIAHDERVEVLVFKLAVATGFDVPRAFTLVSMRTARDADFGIQIVGRIMRVDRRLQGVANVPDPLKYGYVFLADKEGQQGLLNAAQRINSITNELSPVAPVLDVVAVDGGTHGTPNLHYVQAGQMVLNLPGLIRQAETEPQGRESVSNQTDGTQEGIGESAGEDTQIHAGMTSLLGVLGLTEMPQGADGGGASSKGSHGGFGRTNHYVQYSLRNDIDYPTKFKTATMSLNRGNIVRDIVARFRFDEKTLMVAQQSATNILMEETEIFALRKDSPKVISALLAQKEIDNLAQKSLFEADEDGMIDVRDLHTELERQLAHEFTRTGLLHLTSPSVVRESLHKILALRKDILKKAVQEAVYNNLELVDADVIPEMIVSDKHLDHSRLNIYRVYPDDLNNWEREFAEELDSDVTETVKWWHRNPDRKKWSVCVPLPGQPNFYPDFIVGIHKREKGDGILLIETKREINDGRNNAQTKAQAEHPLYKRIMMLYWQNKETWYVVEYDPNTDKNFLSREFRFELLPVY